MSALPKVGLPTSGNISEYSSYKAPVLHDPQGFINVYTEVEANKNSLWTDRLIVCRDAIKAAASQENFELRSSIIQKLYGTKLYSFLKQNTMHIGQMKTSLKKDDSEKQSLEIKNSMIEKHGEEIFNILRDNSSLGDVYTTLLYRDKLFELLK